MCLRIENGSKVKVAVAGLHFRLCLLPLPALHRIAFRDVSFSFFFGLSDVSFSTAPHWFIGLFSTFSKNPVKKYLSKID